MGNVNAPQQEVRVELWIDCTRDKTAHAMRTHVLFVLCAMNARSVHPLRIGPFEFQQSVEWLKKARPQKLLQTLKAFKAGRAAPAAASARVSMRESAEPIVQTTVADVEIQLTAALTEPSGGQSSSSGSWLLAAVLFAIGIACLVGEVLLTQSIPSRPLSTQSSEAAMGPRDYEDFEIIDYHQ